jgi:CBS domain-containing protein
MPDEIDELEEWQDEAYFERRREAPQAFDAALLRQPARALPTRKPLVHASTDSVTDAIRAMQAEHRGVVVITEDGTPGSRLTGIFTERDVLFRIVDRGRNPATLPLGEVMTPDPERLGQDESIARVLNKMSVGGFRHVPIVDEADRPVFVVSVRDVVEFLVEAFPREVLNLPLDAPAVRPRQREGA